MGRIIAINAGSSSLKASIYDFEDKPAIVKEVDKLAVLTTGEPASYTEFIDRLRQATREHEIVAIGHRIVHGGPKYSQPVHISTDVQNDLKTLVTFDPDHLPFALQLIELCSQTFSGVDQFACFDTAFFHNLPRVAQLLALPRQ